MTARNPLMWTVGLLLVGAGSQAALADSFGFGFRYSSGPRYCAPPVVRYDYCGPSYYYAPPPRVAYYGGYYGGYGPTYRSSYTRVYRERRAYPSYSHRYYRHEGRRAGFRFHYDD